MHALPVRNMNMTYEYEIFYSLSSKMGNSLRAVRARLECSRMELTV